jgi:hypothetical protein
MLLPFLEMLSSMLISVYIDSCAWNYLFNHSIDLAIELPQEQYNIFITREIEIEIGNIPDTEEKSQLICYIAESIEKNHICTTSVFGFASTEPDGSLSKVQIYGGFDQGTWQSEADRKWYEKESVKQRLSDKAIKKSGLSNDQADASLGVRSFDSIILTNERKNKAGPLRIAAEEEGQIVYLSVEFEPTGLSLGAYLTKFMQTRN